MGVRDELAAVLSAVHGVRLHGEPLDEVFARLIADAEQRGREDNTDHGMCYVHGSKALARLLDEARREALREAADNIHDATGQSAGVPVWRSQVADWLNERANSVGGEGHA